MPEKTPLAAGEHPPDGVLTIPDVLGANLSVRRTVLRLDQEIVAWRMRQLGHRSWRAGTVSEVERARRNVTVTELLALVTILGLPVEKLLEPQGPVRLGPGNILRPAVLAGSDPFDPAVTVAVAAMDPREVRADGNGDIGEPADWPTVPAADFCRLICGSGEVASVRITWGPGGLESLTPDSLP